MTERSWYWEGTAVGDAALVAPYGAPYSDDMFSENIAKLFNFDRSSQGVLPNATSPYSGGLAVSNPAGATIRVAAGYGLVDGRLYENTADIDNTPGNGDWLFLLRKTWATQQVRMTYKAYAALTQTNLVTWEIPLARVIIAAGVVTDLVDLRQFIGVGGGMVLIEKTVIENDGDSVSWASIPQCFSSLVIMGEAQSHSSGGGLVADDVYYEFNGDAGNNYSSFYAEHRSDGGGSVVYNDYTGEPNTRFEALPLDGSNYGSNFRSEIMGYNRTAFYKTVRSQAAFVGITRKVVSAVGNWLSTSPITSIIVKSHANIVDEGFTEGSVFYLYGIP